MRRLSQNSRQIEESLLIFGPFRTLASGENLRAPLHRVRNLRFDLFALYSRMHRPKTRVLVHAVADFQTLHFSEKLFDELFIDTLDHV